MDCAPTVVRRAAYASAGDDRDQMSRGCVPYARVIFRRPERYCGGAEERVMNYCNIFNVCTQEERGKNEK